MNFPQEYITDCGYPFAGGELLVCEECTICCNSLEECQMNENYSIGNFSPQKFTLLLLGTFCGFLILFAIVLSAAKLKMRTICTLDALELCGPDSVYHFVLCDSIIGWVVVLVNIGFQVTLFNLFLRTSSFENKENSAWVYNMRCPRNSIECEDDSTISWAGWASLFAVMLIYLMLKLIYRAARLANFRLFVGGIILISVALYSIITSFFYNKAIASSDAEIIVNSVVLTFMTEIDEWFHRLLFYMFPGWLGEMMDVAGRFESKRNEKSDFEVGADTIYHPKNDPITLQTHTVLQGDKKGINSSEDRNTSNKLSEGKQKNTSLIGELLDEDQDSPVLSEIKMLTKTIEKLQKEINVMNFKLNEIENKEEDVVEPITAMRRRSYAGLLSGSVVPSPTAMGDSMYQKMDLMGGRSKSFSYMLS